MRGEPKPGRGANHDPWTKSSLWPIFVNKVLLKQGHAQSLAYCLWLFSDTTELHRKDRDTCLAYSKMLTIWLFTEKVFQPYSMGREGNWASLQGPVKTQRVGPWAPD